MCICRARLGRFQGPENNICWLAHRKNIVRRNVFFVFCFLFFLVLSLKKGNRPFLFIFLLAEHHGYARSIYQYHTWVHQYFGCVKKNMKNICTGTNMNTISKSNIIFVVVLEEKC